MEGWRLQRVTKVFIDDLKLAFPLSYVLQKLVVQVEIARLTFPAQKYDTVETEHQMHGFCQNMVLSHVSAMTLVHVGYIIEFLWGQRHAPGDSGE